MTSPLKKATTIVVALFRDGLGVELHPKVAASGVGASIAGLVLAALTIAGVHVEPAGQDIIAASFTVLAGFIHPATLTE